MTFGPIPIVLAVSGHRDLVATDTPAIRQRLHTEFASLRKRYPHSRLQLLNGLAEGADWLAAEVALACGLELIAVLPMQQADYELDFTTPETLAHFHLLLSKASQIRIAPLTDSASRDACYQALGIYLAQHAQRLYALWDGNTENPLPGGTADVVRLCREGIPSENNPLAQPETCQVQHLRCNRRKNPQAYTAQEVNQWSQEAGDKAGATRKYWEEIFHSIDDFNQAASKIETDPTGEVANSHKWLVGEASYPSAIESSAQTFAIADALARAKQKQRHTTLWLLSLLVFLSVFFQQLHLGPDMQWYWLALHIGLGLSAFAAYRFFFSGAHNSEAQYMDWRALAEGLRVQTYWQAAGIEKCASDYYLNSQRDELDWIRHAIRNVTVNTAASTNEANIDWVKQRWLTDQRKFFLSGGSSAAKKQQKLHNWKLISRSLFGAGTVTTAALLLGPFTNLPAATLPWLSLLAAILFLLAAVCRNHANLMAYEEDANRYQKMGSLFERAIQSLGQHQTKGEILSARNILQIIGKEALAENGEWLLLHRQRKFEIPA
ncbi:hypothetical protein CFY91_14125 [Pseudomonas fluvialis]|uniref:SMODS and SLOG-associating 2TM effector domain-containing protein n=1 Tax=Pseudomonas fluvialis TaxID=1793966 RepID=A0ABQ2A998_9PSED|nr:hypothetical protein [Pseudomonas fluvialis]OXM39470.1 hypothetical protein CFY91_14125 [Pseudomonas fluvialis]GGH88527.1 hypothetical protein GCM10007363_01450 [Pseudomonas fluvialis]